MAGDELAPPVHCEPPLVTLTRVVCPAERSRTNTSKLPFVSPATKGASDVKATNRPSPLIADSMLMPLACAPPVATLTREVCLAARSRTKMSVAPLVSSATKFAASEAKLTNRPSALIFEPELRRLPCTPPAPTLIRVVMPATTSRKKMSVVALVSPVTRFVESESNATKRPSALSVGARLFWLPWAPELEMLRRVVVAAGKQATPSPVDCVASESRSFPPHAATPQNASGATHLHEATNASILPSSSPPRRSRGACKRPPYSAVRSMHQSERVGMARWRLDVRISWRRLSNRCVELSAHADRPDYKMLPSRHNFGTHQTR